MNTSLRIEPTAAAMRAASVIAPESVKSGLPNYDQILKAAFCKTIAQIIDRETGLPELLEASGWALDTLKSNGLGKTEVAESLKSAIKKVEGK